MDDVQKGTVRLTHWIEHNLDHLRGYSEVAQTMEQHGLTAASERIRQGMKLIEDANAEFTRALTVISKHWSTNDDPQKSHGDSHDHGHHHHDHHHEE